MPRQKRKRRTKEWKKKLWRLGHKRCCICGQPVTLAEMTIEHRKPLSRGGYDRSKNVAPAHKLCNNLKGNMTEGEWLRKQHRLAKRVSVPLKAHGGKQ